ncbi:SCO7613 C-terminal domain-containing membrane protein [Homoserinibacter sp. GY 40078]|uniref:SCO7613 C-terminal domain-containing membrane protein n=1 Tax=Homoserinibacter sp. GY 40078 TaxID=2603275 RepID=UPI0011CC12CB|nr:hypothetical protein [Homoserinibacter sp. GY 40078]TXK17429.1 hypothetical protein FVQ89_11395 [Homoserinibacter sp. GY 40078]
MTWTEDVARFLLDTAQCPRCDTRLWHGAPAVQNGVCARCHVDLRDERGAGVWSASQAAVAALRERQALIDALPTADAPGASTHEAVGAAASPDVGTSDPSESYPREPYPAASDAWVPTPDRPRSAVSLQSVLAVVGAGLLGVAAIVFTFLNPDLTDFATRTTIIAVVTAVFLGGAWWLRRRGLAFSSEAIGALAMVFLALDIWAFSDAAPDDVSAWFFGALGLAVSGGALLAVGVRTGMRVWIWSGLVGIAIVPAFLGYAIGEQSTAGGSAWPAAWGHIGVVALAWGLLELLPRFVRKLGHSLSADAATLGVIQAVGAITAIPLAVSAAPSGFRGSESVWGAVVLLTLAALGFLTTRRIVPAVWSAVSGLLTSAGLVVLVTAVPIATDDPWLVLLASVAVTMPIVAVGVIRRTGSVHRVPLAVAVLAAAGVVAVPIGVLLTGRSLLLLFSRWQGFAEAIEPSAAGWALAAVAGLLIIAGGVAVLGRGTGRTSARAVITVLARWLAVFAVLGLPLAVAAPLTISIGLALALAAVSFIALAVFTPLRTANLGARLPIHAIGYGALVSAVAFSWPDEATASVTGAVAVAVLALAARTAPPRVRSTHTAVGFGYALVAGAAALSLTVLEPLGILALVTSAAAVVVLAVSIGSWLPVASWYAALGVAAVPFIASVATVLSERSWWTALSVGVVLVLAATLVGTRRSGSVVELRAGAAAILVPTAAIVVVCLTAQLPGSGSPYALPVIAVLVACALPGSALLRAVLARRPDGERAAAAVQLAIEVSSLVTGAVAVVLALVRIAAGLEIAFVVLLVLGIGAAASGLWLRRTYGWWTAAAAWTGALWCAWAMIGIAVVEPYVLPPAIAAIVVGVVFLARGAGERRAPAALVTTGLGAAIAPSLGLLAGGATSGDVMVGYWRVGALLAAGVVFVVVGALLTRAPGVSATRFESIRLPILAAAVVAGAAGTVQAIRVGIGLDAGPVDAAHPLIAALGFSLVSSAIAFAVARIVRTGGASSRWLTAPGLALLVGGTIWAVDANPLAIWTLWGLELALLVAMIATVWRARETRPAFPPVWFQWALAWVTAVAAWSPREVLRVEGFSLPLGLALTLVGAIVLVRGTLADEKPGLNSWPLASTGSWRLLGPGIVATLLPSVMATFTSPDTWRAILVVAMALVAVLIGARKTLAAPFILGIAALPIEILVVFLVQLGDEISPLLWWITLATAGLVLLVIAVGWERRTGADASLAARIRDLR